MFFPFDNPPSLRPIFDFSYDGIMRSLDESLVHRTGFLTVVHVALCDA